MVLVGCSITYFSSSLEAVFFGLFLAAAFGFALAFGFGFAFAFVVAFGFLPGWTGSDDAPAGGSVEADN